MVIETLQNYIPNQYLRAFILLTVLIILLRTILYIALKTITILTKKTKTNIDDIFIEKSSKPLTFLSILIAFAISIKELLLSENVSNLVNNIAHSLIAITVAYIIYLVLNLFIIEGIKSFARKSKTSLDDNLISLGEGSIKIALMLILFLYILNLWGIEIGPLLAGLGIAGIAIALAIQPILGNIFSGASIILDKSISIGNLVNLENGLSGKIEKIGFRSTKIKTFDNEIIIVPNSKLAEGTIHNIALPEPKVRVVVPFGVAYGSNIEKVKNIILKEIKSLKHIVEDPNPTIRFLEMADSSLNFKAYFYIDSFENRLSSVDEITTKIYNALNKAKISIPFPQIDINLKKQ